MASDEGERGGETIGRHSLSAALQCEEARQLRRECRSALHSYRQSLAEFDRAVADFEAAFSGKLWLRHEARLAEGES